MMSYLIMVGDSDPLASDVQDRIDQCVRDIETLRTRERARLKG
jgi:hypothetical protein